MGITISIDTVRDFKMRRASILSLIGSSSAGYFKVDRAGVTWSGANDACKAKGLNLVTFDDEAEYNEVMAFIGDSTDGYWTGFSDDHGTVEPAGYHPFAEGEPNNKIGNEFCIRLRFGLMNDALCEIYWVGPKKHNIGMGYICDGDVELTDMTEAGRPVYHNPETNAYLSFSYNAA